MPKFEVVIENSADKYDLFLESFDKHIKNSKLKKVTREGKLEWNVTGDWIFSKGVILIYQRKNDIICRLIPDKDGGTLPLNTREEVLSVLEEAYDEVIGPLDEVQTKISMVDNCIVCNLVIGEDDKIIKCPYCSGLAHRDHLLEYVKVKGQCPSCGKILMKEELT